MTDTPGQKQSNLETKALLKEVAKQTHLTEEAVRLVFDTLCETAREAIRQGQKVVFRNFGAFHAKRTKGYFEGVTIRFKPSNEFKQSLKKVMAPMEKYAVELKEEAVLLAKVTNACPDCKSELEQKDPPKCPNCGTGPFEKKESP